MSKERIRAAIFTVVICISLTACGSDSSETPVSGVENGVAAIEDAMTIADKNSSVSADSIDDLRSGSSDDTVATSDDFPSEYGYGTGKIADYSRSYMLKSCRSLRAMKPF